MTEFTKASKAYQKAKAEFLEALRLTSDELLLKRRKAMEKAKARLERSVG